MNIRPHTQVIITKNGKLFCCTGYDSVKKEKFYRTPGGGIDFGEAAFDAIKREMKEEFAAELINLKQVDVEENIFTYTGDPKHEIIFIFSADFKNDSMYENKVYPILDNLDASGAEWHPIDDFVSGKNILYPKTVLEFLKSNTK